MKRPPLLRISTPWVACLTLALGGCALVEKKDAAGTEQAPGETEEAAEKAGADEAKKDEPSSHSTGEGAQTPETRSEPRDEAKPTEPPADPAAAEEFKGLAKGEPEFILACRSLAAGGKATMTGRDSFVFDTRELGALGANSKTGSPRHQAMVAAITAHAGGLRSAGVELVIAPVPPKPVVYPDYLGAEPPLKDRRYDSYLQALYAELEKAGVRVVDVTKALRSDRFDKNSSSFPRTGLLWSPAAAATSARAVHAAARRTASAKALQRDKTIVARDAALTLNGDVFKVKSVGWAQGDRLVPASAGENGAAVLVIGDEHAGAHRGGGVNSSLPDHLSLAFGTAVDSRITPGLGWKEAAEWTPAANAPTKVVVWCFSAAQFLEPPAPPPKKPSSSGRRADTRSGERAAPRFNPALSPGLRLRDDPGLEGRQD